MGAIAAAGATCGDAQNGAEPFSLHVTSVITGVVATRSRPLMLSSRGS